jgi:peptidoglycan/xylan/chitin deacetylase (PgdA/CDA1 family)
MIIARIPRVLSRAIKSLTWEIPTAEKVVYLTFDDGPTPEVTKWVLAKLDQFKAKATFFCLGKNVEAHPDLYDEIRERGHGVGNHSYSHMKGFRTSVEAYKEDADRASTLIDSKLFRPPYGRILPGQVKKLSQSYTVIMWTVLSVDYNPKVSSEQVVRNVLQNVRPGSIIVFHDSLKASKNLYAALPVVLEYLKDNGYKMESIDPQS